MQPLCDASEDDFALLESLFTENALNVAPRSVADFALASFWRDRYSAEAVSKPSIEWYAVTLHAVLEAAGLLITKAAVVVQLGCGNSSWGSKLSANGFTVLDSDVDAELLSRLRKQRREVTNRTCNARLTPRQSFAALDATSLAVRKGCADIVLEKGVFDALSHGEGGAARVRTAVANALNCLQPGGSLLCVTTQAGRLLALLGPLENSGQPDRSGQRSQLVAFQDIAGYTCGRPRMFISGRFLVTFVNQF